ncbi:MAG TPA: BadF/BadG/BcrA/BcrD ATPase family protein [Streptosporangiaceae bacterium]
MSQAIPAVLAIDGGNSKTDAALVAIDGTLLAQVRGPGMPGRLGEQTVGVIGDLVRAVTAAAGCPPSAAASQADGGPADRGPADDGPADDGLAGRGLVGRGLVRPGPQPAGLVASHLVACVANADLPSEERQLERMLHEQGWTASTVVANDTYAVLRAGLDDLPAAGASRFWGVGITCGTGINCVGNAPDGRTAGFLALGMISGDWGGGGGLGLEAQWHAVRAADGRGPQTALLQAVPAHFGMTDPLDLAEAIHLGEIGWDKLAGLVPVIFEVAGSGDQVARDLVLRLAREIFLLARSAITRLHLAAEPVPVVLGGGIIASGNPLLIEEATRLITAEFPAADVRVLLHAPVAGASLLGLDIAGATVAARQRLRAAFASQQAIISTVAG